jgi:hypothetical protein
VANSNTPFGLRVVRGGSSAPFNAQASVYSIPTSDSTNAYYFGDVVKTANGADTNGVPNVTKAAGTDAMRGVIVGIMPVYPGVSVQGTPLALENVYVPATKAAAYYVMVEDDPDTLFMVQDDGITTANLVAGSANKNFSLTITAGSTNQSESATVLLSSSFATTSTLNMKAMGLAQIPGNVFGAYAKWLCRANTHELIGSTAGV